MDRTQATPYLHLPVHRIGHLPVHRIEHLPVHRIEGLLPRVTAG
jgi:hypothetical protein